MKHGIRYPWLLLAAAAMVCMSAGAIADDAPAAPPSGDDIKACIRQIDIANKWSFDWKRLEIGAPRRPRNSYEALYAPAGSARADSLYGYPVHVVFSVNGRATIDSIYWLVRDSAGHWQIPAVCSLP
jgi:hypothetical protein